MSKKDGFTLTEMFVALAFTSSVLAIAVGLISQTMTLTRAVQNNCETIQTSNRFFEKFRSDCHAAVRFDCQSTDRMEFENGPVKTTYSTSGNKIQCETRTDNRLIGSEEVTLPLDCSAEFKADDSRRIATLAITKPNPTDPSHPKVERRIEAAIGTIYFSLTFEEKTQ